MKVVSRTLVLALVLTTVASAQDSKSRTKGQDQLSLLKTFYSEFITISPGKGKFPKHAKLQKPFRIAKYEVPQNLWRSVMGANPSRWQGERNSVEQLSFDDARKFCERVTAKMRDAKLIRPQDVVRLPYEDEWEYAASAGTKTSYSFGDDVEKLDEYAWSTRNAAGNDPAVGVLKPNPWGLYDIHGYLWEWCLQRESLDSSNKLPTPETKSRPQRNTAVLRGGSWKDPAEQARDKVSENCVQE